MVVMRASSLLTHNIGQFNLHVMSSPLNIIVMIFKVYFLLAMAAKNKLLNYYLPIYLQCRSIIIIEYLVFFKPLVKFKQRLVAW